MNHGSDFDKAAWFLLLLARMRWWRIVTVFLFLTVWLTAREHCNLETLGVLPASCASECAKACESDDACELVENACYKQAVDHVHVTAPTLLLCLFVAPVPEVPAAPPELRQPRRVSTSLARERTWQFVERAAPPARAPAVSA